jgi:hypothetical protein
VLAQNTVELAGVVLDVAQSVEEQLGEGLIVCQSLDGGPNWAQRIDLKKSP